MFNAGFTPAACRRWFLSADIFGWRNLKTNINCTTTVAVIIYGGQDGRCAEGEAEPIGFTEGVGITRQAACFGWVRRCDFGCGTRSVVGMGFLGKGLRRGRLVVRPPGSSCSFGATVWDTLCKEVVRRWAP